MRYNLWTKNMASMFPNALRYRGRLKIQSCRNLLQSQHRKAGSQKPTQSMQSGSPLMETRWKLFTRLDLKSEHDMLEMAQFLQTVIENVPSLQIEDPLKDIDLDKQKEITLDQLAIDKAHFDLLFDFDGDPFNFRIPDARPTLAICNRLVKLYRAGGKLNQDSVDHLMKEAYRLNKSLPNVINCRINRNERMTIVGDLHGQLQDLLHIFDQNGLPSLTNKYIFNGDFVDRGPDGLEITLLLLAYQLAIPCSVFLNRGNHEDFPVCCAYGFQKEVKQKYNDMVFRNLVNLFRFLPLACTINNKVMVIHGGVPHQEGITLQDILALDRTAYSVKPKKDIFERKNKAENEQWQVMQSMLWSDPGIYMGVDPNPRGAGVVFGADVTKKFLQNNKLDMIIRSHQCVWEGWALPYEDENAGLLGTVFSASNYQGSGNLGAYLTFTTTIPRKDYYIAGKSESAPFTGFPIYYCISTYSAADASKASQRTSEVKMSLFDLILKRKHELEDEFQKYDPQNTGMVNEMDWAETMAKVTGVQINWQHLFSALVSNEARSDKNDVIYRLFLDKFSLNSDKLKEMSGKKSLVNSLYGNYRQLEAVFHFFDKDGDGVISKEEFQQGCTYINTFVPEKLKISNHDRLLAIMDIDGSTGIDINEFFETFRIFDAKDGLVDGCFSL